MGDNRGRDCQCPNVILAWDQNLHTDTQDARREKGGEGGRERVRVTETETETETESTNLLDERPPIHDWWRGDASETKKRWREVHLANDFVQSQPRSDTRPGYRQRQKDRGRETESERQVRDKDKDRDRGAEADTKY